MLLSNRLNSIKPSPSIAANALVVELRKQGRDIVNFTIGEPDLATPDHIVQAAVEAMQNGDTHYTAAAGTVEVRRAIAEKLQRDNQLSYGIDEIVVGVGGKHIIYHAFAATLNAGDEVVVHSPYWVSYPDIATLNEATPVIIDGDESNGFKLRPEDLARAITPKTKWVVLNTPNNPTGAVYTEQELSGLAEVLRLHPHVLILSDEIYEHFVFGKRRHLSLLNVAPDLKDQTLVLNGVSKGYAMTGWRLGFGAGPKALIAGIVKLISQTTTCPTSISQAAAVAAFAGDQAPVEKMRDIYAARRQLMMDLLGEIPELSCAAPKGAFYVFPNVSGLFGKRKPDGEKIQSDDDVVNYLLNEVGVATVSGTAYGMSPYIRLSFATNSDQISEGLRRIKDAIERLR
ncbi:pyridoxal phosphate-dependent aminotransferase [Pseudomonas sp. PSKL.D1]|uniref:pyridoxal phosphate-dependent aminotransferase n=1 Tax=Pseudomonas sp. PSKL.D1 TaxID=3029060 RepID=UPI00238191C7|nr:pyridoxal phosphate-dependent aminotransferase [Pseudomonas sp. PSKL.D1]WDY55784.1 pyridoxal phosphate-dependent aminotransferase [Pseudomonas sp. PSKL.D1]